MEKNIFFFKSNHSPTDLEVLVCWEDNEPDDGKLPKKDVS
jgi:hypothetical protein